MPNMFSSLFNRHRHNLLAILPLVLFLALPMHLVYSLGLSTGTAISVEIFEGNPKPGDIISYINGEYIITTEPFDVALFGVVTVDSAMTMSDKNLENPTLVVSEGEAFVRVSTENGNIEKGDFITSSEIPGVGVKADISGQIVGVALQDYSTDDPELIDDILVQMDIRANVVSGNVRVNLIDTLRSGSQAPFLTPLTSLRYILAALVTAGAFVIGFASFGKTSGSGVEALGRNPLAHKTIQRSIVFNLILTAFIMLVGLVLAYLILVL